MADYHQWNDARAPSSELTSFQAPASLGTCLTVAINILKTFWRPIFTLRCLLPLTSPIFPKFSGTESEKLPTALVLVHISFCPLLGICQHHSAKAQGDVSYGADRGNQ